MSIMDEVSEYVAERDRVRRFKDGDRFLVSGMRFRVRKGAKGPNDLVLEWQTAGGWVPIDMAATALQCAFLYENEDFLYPPSRGLRGGRMFTGAMQHGIDNGWETVRDLIREQRRAGSNRPVL